MRAAPTVLTILSAGAILVACDAAPSPTAVDEGEAGNDLTAEVTAPSAELSVVTPFPTGAPIPGALATKTISGDGVNVFLRTHGLEPGHAYTLWAGVFNHPENCVQPFACGGPDVMAGDPAVGVDAIGVVGLVAGASGHATFAGRVRVGQTGTTGVGLRNLEGAQIDLVVRHHGPKLPGSAQLSDFNGGCPPNACANVQIANQF